MNCITSASESDVNRQQHYAGQVAAGLAAYRRSIERGAITADRLEDLLRWLLNRRWMAERHPAVWIRLTPAQHEIVSELVAKAVALRGGRYVYGGIAYVSDGVCWSTDLPRPEEVRNAV